jgi:predicted permease
LAVGLVPALQAFGTDSPDDLRASARGMTGGAQHIRRALVVAEVAGSVVLLVGAALMLRTFLTLRPVDSGFAVSDRMIMYTSLPGEWEVSDGHRQFMKDVIGRLESLPDVESASASTYLPLGGYTATSTVKTAGATVENVWSSWVSAHFLDDMAAAMIRGRDFEDTDTASSPPVAIVNETFARQYFPAADPIGQIVDVKADWQKAASPKRIVVVMRDFREGGRDRIQRPEIYAPYDQEPGPGFLYFLVKTRGSRPQVEAGMRAAVASARPGQLAERIEPLQTLVDRSVSRPKFGAWLFGVFAAIAVGLATLGLGAVIAWWVSQRQREIGVRIALGANASAVTSLVVGQGVRLAAMGIAIGVAVSVFATRLLSDWLYGVSPNDTGTFIVCSAAMLLITIGASWLPARRAARVDPAGTLRAE